MEINKSDNILITGGTGLVGTAIVHQLLADGYTNLTVVNTSGNRIKDLEEGQVKYAVADIQTHHPISELVQESNAIIHTAATVSFDPKLRKQMYQTNVVGTEILVNTALAANVKKFLFVSSVAALGRDGRDKIIDEQTDWINSKYNTYYGITKHLAEMHVWRGYAEGLNTVILNPSLILGEGDYRSSSLGIFPMVAKGLPYYPTGSLGLVGVEDVATLTAKMLIQPISGERYIVSAGNLSYQELFAQMAPQIGAKAPSKPAPKWMLGIYWRWEKLRSWLSGSSPIVTQETVRSTSHQSLYDNSKSQAIEGFSYTPVQEVIAKYSKRFVQNQEKQSEN